jgi:hypothetical protein
MSNVSQWETSAPNNNAAPPDGAPEGMAANTVNDTMREMMAAVARWYQDTNGSLVTGGAGNAYTLSTNNNNSSLTDLPLVVFVANRANTGAATLNVDGLGAKSLRFNGAALPSGAIQADTAYIAIYNGEDDAFDLVGVPTRDASAITTGTLSDDRLSDNVPLKNAPNVFSAVTQTIRSTSPHLRFHETDANTNEGVWSIITNGGVWRVNTHTDESPTATVESAIRCLRSGTTVTEVELNATLLDFNGALDLSGNLTLGGSAISSGAVTWTNTGTLVIGASDTTVRLQGGTDGSGGPGAGFQVTSGGAAAIIRAGGVGAANTVATFGATGITFGVATTMASARIASEGGVIYHDSTNNLGGKIVLSSSEATTAEQVGAAGDMRFVYAT